MHGPKTEQLMLIHEQLKYILELYEQRLDCICFVGPANSNNLSPEEIDFLESIMYLFPNDQSSDLSTDISCFFTFADAGPACLENGLKSSSVKNFKSYFVNWSAFFRETNEFSDSFWNMNIKSLDNFFNHLNASKPKTLRLTLEGEPPAPQKKENVWKLQPEVKEDVANLQMTKTNGENFIDNKTKLTYNLQFFVYNGGNQTN